MDIYLLVEGLLTRLGFDGIGIMALYAVAVVLCRLIGNLIPDDKTGFLGIVRKLARIVGLDVSNRITRGVSQNDVAKAAMSIANVSRLARQDKVPIPGSDDKDDSK